MLGLRENVSRHPVGVCALIGDDEDLARACEHVDAHLAVNFLFCERHIDVAGARDNVHLGNALGAVGKRRDRLCAAHLKDGLRAALLGRDEGQGMHLSLFRGSRDDDVLNARGLRGKHRHQHGGRERRRTARDIDARPLHGTDDIPRRPAVFGDDVVLPARAAVIFKDVVNGKAQALQELGRDVLVCLRVFLLGDAEIILAEDRFIELFLVFKDGLVAALLHA